MKLDLEGVAKAAYVGFLLIMWAVLDKVGIHDQVLVLTIQGLIAAIVGWHGINQLPGYRRAGPDAPALPPIRQAPPPIPPAAAAAREAGAQE
ncbi:hypothetical protein WJ32_08555 [Burkholderia ubonensis]|uniref:Holin n=1 Tax=Burkholderia ubonensis TaxID=101571 RepID=A0A103QVR1_9BURK|nr:hypothetical protein [Burkholderia ubonensis]AOJ62504.1 hypothetical protein WJ32_08555 [Burkholderia ubonensis]KVG56467.1 hypothetical protein WJ33_37220 [Burkholderia ubonensis]